jgi:hypothetical protein
MKNGVFTYKEDWILAGAHLAQIGHHVRRDNEMVRRAMKHNSRNRCSALSQ